MASRRLLVLGVVILGVGLLSGWLYLKSPDTSIEQVATRSNVARWWRCRDDARPLLASNRQSWTLTYSWTGGYGPGDVEFVLNSDGSARLESRATDDADQPPKVAELRLDPARIAQLMRNVDASGLLCQTTQPRRGYRVVDLGNFEVKVKAGSYTKSLVIDECHTLVDPAAFFEVRKALIQLAPAVADKIGWRPYGTESGPDSSCGGS